MKKFDKIIAIADSPLNGEIKANIKRLGFPIERAYKKGDVFELLSMFSDCYVIWHPVINTSMSVSKNDFVSLSKWRDARLNELGI